MGNEERPKTEWEKWSELQTKRMFGFDREYISFRELEERDRRQAQSLGLKEYIGIASD